MAQNENYEAWLNNRREAEPAPELTDRIMDAISEPSAAVVSSSRFASRINGSSFTRWSACTAAFVVGCMPFMFVAYVAELIVF